MTYKHEMANTFIGVMHGAKQIKGLGQIEIVVGGQDSVRPLHCLGQDSSRGLCPPSRAGPDPTRIKRRGTQETRHPAGVFFPCFLEATIVIASCGIDRMTGLGMTDQGQLQARHDE